MKKIALILAAVMVFPSLTACGGKKIGSSGDKTTITVWSSNTHSKSVYEELVNKYNQGEGKEKGIFIDYQVKDNSSYAQTLELALQNGDAPDLFIGSGFLKTVKNDYVMPIDDLPNGAEIIKKYEGKLVINNNTYKDKVYRVPVSTTTQGLLYNKDMFKAAGIVDENGEAKPPETFDELREDAKLLTNASKKEYGIILPLKWTGWFGSDILSTMQSSCGNMGYDPVTGGYDYSGLAPIMDTFLGVKADKSIFPGADGIDNDQARAQFATGNIGMKFGYSFDVGVLNDQFPAKCDWGVAPYPVIDKNSKYLQRMSYDMSFFINKKSAEKIDLAKLEEAYKFFLSDDFAKECYINGVSLPYDWNIVKDIKLEKTKKGWNEFAELIDISSNYASEPSLDMQSEASIQERFINNVWNGSMTSSELCAEYKTVVEAAKAKYYETHSDESDNVFLKSDWNIKR